MPEVRNISNKFKIKIFVIKWTILWTSVLILWATLNPYLRDFGNVRERHFWTKNPELLLVLMTSYLTENFLFHDDLNYVSKTNYTLPGRITLRHHREISCDWWDYTRNSGNWASVIFGQKNPTWMMVFSLAYFFKK